MENTKQHKSSYRKLIAYYQASEKKLSESEIENQWNFLMQKMGEEDKRKHLRIRLYVSVAYVAALLVGFIWIAGWKQGAIPQHQHQCLESVIADLDQHLSDTTKQVVLITQKQSLISIKKGAVVSYSSKGEVSIDKKKMKIEEKKMAEDQIIYNQLIVPKGKFSRLILADGSSLYVNAGTKVVYPSRFVGEKREIYVDGEIFIDVQRDDKHKFIVKTPTCDIEVLGTAFNVNAYKSLDKSEVVLLRGKVIVRGENQQAIHLNPNELLDLSNGVFWEKRIVNTDDYVAWTKGRLPLSGRNLKEIIQRLSLFYGVDISLNPAIEQYQLHGTIDMSVPIDKVLERMTRIIPISCEKNQERFYLNRKVEIKNQ